MPTKWLGEQLDLPRATTIHHGLIHISPARKTEPQSSHAPVIAFQGRLVSTKGARVLLDAAKILCEQVQEFELVVIGDGPERAKLEAVAAQAPLIGQVRFTGKLASAELEKELARASVVVVPSLGGEVFGLVVAENMLRGIPVIASALGSFLEVVGGDGITFRVSDAGELACKLGELLQLPSQIQKLGEAGRQRIETRFSLQAMIEKHREAYRRL